MRGLATVCKFRWFSCLIETLDWMRAFKYKLINHSFHYDVRKYSFTPRVVNIWNSLPDCVVDANSVDVFKKRLDKFWCNQAVRFDWKASLNGTGNRSEISLDNSLYCIFEMDNWDPDIEALLCLRPRLSRCLVLWCWLSVILLFFTGSHFNSEWSCTLNCGR